MKKNVIPITAVAAPGDQTRAAKPRRVATVGAGVSEAAPRPRHARSAQSTTTIVSAAAAHRAASKTGDPLGRLVGIAGMNSGATVAHPAKKPTGTIRYDHSPLPKRAMAPNTHARPTKAPK